MKSFTSTYFLTKIKFRYRLGLVDTVSMTPTSRTVLFLLQSHLQDSLYSTGLLFGDALFTRHSHLHRISPEPTWPGPLARLALHSPLHCPKQLSNSFHGQNVNLSPFCLIHYAPAHRHL